MAVGTGNISLEEVRVEMGLPSNSSLASCFFNARDSDFDPAYKGAKDRLSNFRGYSHSGGGLG